MNVSPRKLEIFLSKIRKTESCWVWIGSKHNHGYGNLHLGRRKNEQGRRVSMNSLTHRISYEHFIGPIPAGLSVCHTCDNKLCVNPAHLFLGSHQDNMSDMAAKRRSARRERHGMSKLSAASVAAIRQKYRPNAYGYKLLAKEYGVDPITIRNVITNRTWRT